jgi:similar to stage IV sporulation protein
LFLLIVYLFSSMVWQINISGVNEDAALTLRQAASETGLYVGAWKWSLHSAQAVQDKLLRKVPDLIWVGVNFQGSRVNVEAIEKIKGIDKQSTAPHNIVAEKPGVIRHVFATRGEVVVGPGQVVHPGEVIISGNLGQGAARVPADGKVLAEVWYTTDVNVPLQVSHSGMTGLKYRQGSLMLGSFGVHLWGWKQPHYHSQFNTVTQTHWSIGKYQLPVQWKTVTNYEVQRIALVRSEQKAKAAALQLANQDVRSKIGEDGLILSQTVLHEEVSHGKLYEKVWTKAEEDIGVAKPIAVPLSESNPQSGANG